MRAPREKFIFVACSYAGTDVWESDYLATVDVDPESPNYSKVVSRAAMPVVGDEIFRFGWNVCSSSHKTPSNRMYMLVPGLRSG
jgi:selenium-binding protein 1